MTMQTPDLEGGEIGSVPPAYEPQDGAQAARDYERVRAAIGFVSQNWRAQPPLHAIAAHVGLSPAHFHRLFTRWAGLSPKAFLQAIALDHARAMLRQAASVLETAYEVGLSGPSRLHDLFVEHEAMTPGDYKRNGAGLAIAYGFHDSPFGRALVMVTERGLCGVAFTDDRQGESAVLADMRLRWPEAVYSFKPERTKPYVARIFCAQPGSTEQVRLVMIGTDFELRVWRTLLRVPVGSAVSYSDLAEFIGHPRAARAVGAAVGRNPLAFVVPCHRVLAKSGGLGGYHWGLTRKRAIVGWEAGRLALAATPQDRASPPPTHRR